MIARTWSGKTAAADADRYVDYLRETGVRACRETPGNRGAHVFRRLVDGRAEFFFLSLWESLDAVKAFAGETPEQAVFFPEDERFLVEKEETVGHWEVVVGPSVRSGSRTGETALGDV